MRSTHTGWPAVRIWLVHPMELDDNRLRAQHREYDIIYGRINRGGKWVDWEKPEHREQLMNYHLKLHNEIDKRDGVRWDCSSTYAFDYSYTKIYRHPYQDPRGYTANEDRWALVCRWQGVFRG